MNILSLLSFVLFWRKSIYRKCYFTLYLINISVQFAGVEGLCTTARFSTTTRDTASQNPTLSSRRWKSWCSTTTTPRWRNTTMSWTFACCTRCRPRPTTTCTWGWTSCSPGPRARYPATSFINTTQWRAHWHYTVWHVVTVALHSGEQSVTTHAT